MAEHEPSIGGSDDWYTPPEIFAALGLTFDLDPCSPGAAHWVPAHKVYTKADDGLHQPWKGLVFVNPPFGGRYGHLSWLSRFFDHGNGIAVARAYTSSDWWHQYMPRAHSILFPRGKTRFIPSQELRRKLDEDARAAGRNGWHNAPGHGIALVGLGPIACGALESSKLGMIWRPCGNGE